MQRRRRLTDVEWRLVIWTLAPLLLFTASIGKQPRYILPVLPPIAMMLGPASRTALTASRDRLARRELTVATLGTAAMFAAHGRAVLSRARLVRIRRTRLSRGPGSPSSPSAALALAMTAVRAFVAAAADRDGGLLGRCCC